MSADIAAYMNHQNGNPFQQIQAIYWSVHPSVLRGILGQVRTVLTEFVAELRTAVGESEELRLRRLCDTVMQGLTKAAPTVASQLALAAGQDAIHALGH